LRRNPPTAGETAAATALYVIHSCPPGFVQWQAKCLPLLPLGIVNRKIMWAAATTAAALAWTPDAEENAIAFYFFAESDSFIRAVNGLTINFGDDVTRVQPGFRRI